MTSSGEMPEEIWRAGARNKHLLIARARRAAYHPHAEKATSWRASAHRRIAARIRHRVTGGLRYAASKSSIGRAARHLMLFCDNQPRRKRHGGATHAHGAIPYVRRHYRLASITRARLTNGVVGMKCDRLTTPNIFSWRPSYRLLEAVF